MGQNTTRNVPAAVPETTVVGQSTEGGVLERTPESVDEENEARRPISAQREKKKVAKKSKEKRKCMKERDEEGSSEKFRLEEESRPRREVKRPARFCDRVSTCCSSKSTV